MAESKRLVWRRRIAPIALVLALGLLATRTCRSESASVEVQFDLGSATDQIRELEVDLLRDPAAAPVGRWSGRPGEAPIRPWQLRVDPGSYILRFRITLRDGQLVRFEKATELSDGATVTVPVASALEHR